MHNLRCLRFLISFELAAQVSLLNLARDVPSIHLNLFPELLRGSFELGEVAQVT